jgi:lysophospholipase L1-like esterase
MIRKLVAVVVLISLLCGIGARGVAAESLPPVQLTLTSPWQLQAALPAHDGQPAITATLDVPPPSLMTVEGERYDDVPLFNSKGPVWGKGVKLTRLKAQEVTTPDLLVPESFVLRSGPGADAQTFTRGQDYEAELRWGSFGRLEQGAIAPAQPVYASYRHGLLRLDSIVLTSQGKLEYRAGQPVAASPLAPELRPGEQRLANIWLPGRIERLREDHLFPILETADPQPPAARPGVAARLTPKALAKLRGGEPLKILAWGDSVTDGRYVPNPDQERWQAQFVVRLKQRFPRANIELVTEAWGGRNTSSYLAEPPGSVHNYAEKVLGARPDLIVSEFVNDAGLPPAQVEERYGKLLADFQGIGAEWIILTPHYTRPDWMGLTRERDIDDDPRPYVAGLREFAARHNVALADAALRYGRLWRQGTPYSTLMSNSINHPDPRGMAIFADALLELFPER